MSEEKKPGLFRRLFGGEEAAAEAADLNEEVRKPEPKKEAEAPSPKEEAKAPDSETPAASEPAEIGKVPETPPKAPKTPDEPRPSPGEVRRESVESHPQVAEQRPLQPIPPPPAEPAAAEEMPVRKGWFSRLKTGLSRSSNALTESIGAVFTKRKLDADALQDLEDILISADLGVETAMSITEAVGQGRYDKEIAPEEIGRVLAAEVEKVLEPVAAPLEIDPAPKPHIILVVGVNGTGKTTTIGKFSAHFRQKGHSVMLAAGDTFRAAAIEQLKIWGERTGAPVVARDIGADAAGLVFDAVKQAKETATDVLMIDTAGRLQNKANLMAELEKVVRVIKKQDETAPHDVILVLDATTGQNAVQQVEIFRRVAGVTGLVMTKLDGTARGGILVAIAAKYGLPVHAIGIGEGVEDLQPFAADEFARAIAGIAA